jgi:monofunctional biosynthetic peptidoglycan transglycosylase
VLPLLLLLASPLAAQDSDVVKIVHFGTDSADDWFVVNDGVMGGRSSSALNREGGVAVFEGYLSLENNGGFASVRAPITDGALSGASRIVLRVRGDGKRYQLRLRPGRRFDGVAFAAGFETRAGEWIIVELPVEAFEPTYRGFRPRGVGALDPSRIGQVGIMLTDKQDGAFRLELEWIGMTGGEGDPPID